MAHIVIPFSFYLGMKLGCCEMIKNIDYKIFKYTTRKGNKREKNFEPEDLRGR